MRIAVIGSGYVGLVSGVCFSEFGFNVTCVDKDKNKINKLNSGKIPIYEPGLENIYKRNSAAKRLIFTSDLASAVKGADVVFIAVGTPSRRGDGHADLKFVYEVSKEISKAIDGYTLVVTKSTVPVGTGREIKEIVKNAINSILSISSLPVLQNSGYYFAASVKSSRILSAAS